MKFRDGNDLAGSGQTLKRFMALLLVLGVFGNSLFDEVCLCGEMCPASSHARTKGVVAFPVHMCCSGILCKGCQMEEGERTKSVNPKIRTVHAGTFSNVFLPAMSFDPAAENALLEGVYPLSSGKISYPPIYLKNLTIIC